MTLPMEYPVAAQVLAINHDQGREMFAFIAELAVRIIFDNWNAVAVGQQDEFVATAFGQCVPAGFWKLGSTYMNLGPERRGFSSNSVRRPLSSLGPRDTPRHRC